MSQRLTKQSLCRSDHTGAGYKLQRIRVVPLCAETEWRTRAAGLTVLSVTQAAVLCVEKGAEQRAVARRRKPAVCP